MFVFPPGGVVVLHIGNLIRMRKTTAQGGIQLFYHTSNSRECMGVNEEALQLHAVYKKPYFLLQVMRESVSVLQVT